MGANVFANGKEISGKGSGNKTIAAMPDVCLSPPSPPAGPIPIPYPNFSQASDTTDGSKKVKIGGKEVCLKGKSSFKKSKGDEAATNSFGASVVSHKIQGAVKHQAGSFDVKFEGSNVVRFGDITTGNHSNPGLPPGPDVGKPAPSIPGVADCETLSDQNEDARDNDVEEGAKDKPYTLTTALKTDSTGKKFMKAATPKDVVKSGKSSGYQPTNKKNTMACTQEKYNPQKQNDTEPKLIEPEYKAGGTLVMKIHHQFIDRKTGALTSDGMPCGSCKKSVCAAQKCGLQIYLCNDEDKPVDAKDLCENGKPKPVNGTGGEKREYWASFGLG